MSASLDQVFGRQRVKASAGLQASRFSQDSSLDNNAPTLNAEWDWQTGERWEGEMGVTHARSLYRYYLSEADTSLGRNMQTDNQQFFRARLGVVTAWTLEAGWSAYQRSYSADYYRSENQTRRALSAGVRFQPQPDFTARLNLRHTDGQYPDFNTTLGPDDFGRWDVESLLNIRMSAASAVDLRLAHTNEAHSQPSAQSGPHWTGSARWQWQPTGKLSFSTRVVRDTDTSDQLLGEGLTNSESRRTTQLEWGGQWAATDKIQLGLSLQQSWRQLQQDLGDGDPLDGRDRSRTIALQLGYQPLQALALGCNASRETRDVSGTTGLSYPFRVNTISCFGRFDWR